MWRGGKLKHKGCGWKFFPLVTLTFGLLGSGVSLRAQSNSDDGQSNSTQSWSSTTEERDSTGSTNPTRTTISHKENKNGSSDKQTTERMGDGGRYQPYSETEKETVRVNSTTTKVIERTFARDPNGNRQLIQVTQSESHSSPGGEEHVVRTTSNPDANGRLQTIRREVADSKQLGPGVQETKTTVSSPDTSGSLIPIQRTVERQTQSGENAVKFRKETSAADLNGGWQTNEIREGTIKQNGTEQVKEENILRPNADGQFAVAERTVSREAASSPGNQSRSVESYSTNTPGMADEGRLSLNQRVTTQQSKGPDGREVTRRQVQQRNAGNPGNGLGTTEQRVEVVRPGANGTLQTSTVQTRDANGNMGVVWVDMGKSDKSTLQVDAVPDDAKAKGSKDKGTEAKGSAASPK